MPTFTTADGASLYYRLQGRGEGSAALIFVHGWCSNLTHFDPQARYFARRHRILRVDRRGMGRSSTPGSGHTARQHADDIAAVAREAGITRAIVVGHAGGGPATLEILRSHPRLARAGVLVDSGMYPEARLGDPGNAFGSVLTGMIEALSGPAARRAFRKMYGGFFGPKCDRAVKKRAVDDAMRTPLEVAIAELRGMAVSTEAIADGITKPVLWLTAAGVDESYIAAHLEKVQFGQVVGSGHFPQLEVPAQVNAMLETFITQL